MSPLWLSPSKLEVVTLTPRRPDEGAEKVTPAGNASSSLTPWPNNTLGRRAIKR